MRTRRGTGGSTKHHRAHSDWWRNSIHLGARAGWQIFGEGRIAEAIADLATKLDEANLRVSTRLFESTESLAQKWEEEAKKWAAENPDGNPEEWKKERLLTKDEAESLSKNASNLEQTVWAEAKGQVSFITREKRYDINRLLDDVGSLMAKGVFDGLPDLAQSDFASAGRCIAFELPTAAAFHLMRGTEATLRDFYCGIVKRDRVNPQMWGPMTAHLRKRRDMPPEVLMNNLDNIRRSFRNPTQHPEKVYDVDEAQDLMSLSIDVVTRMQRHLQETGR
jgi:hypothetical protein